jgi:hypothetical protein
MMHINELEKILSGLFYWHKSRIFCLIQTIQALFLVKTVNLSQIASAFRNDVKTSSSYRRLQRFFKDFSFDMSTIVVLVLRLFVDKKFLLIIDRTHWKWGKQNINILMLSLAYKGIAIPILWTVSPKGGNSSIDERVFLLKKVIAKIGIKKIYALLADREFIGEEWFRYLIKQKIPFVIRIKKNHKASGIKNGIQVPVEKLLEKLNFEDKLTNHPTVVFGQFLYISIKVKNKIKEPWILASNVPFDNPFNLYKRRWEIETLFACLKTKGFRLEDTHMTSPQKIEKLLFILTIAFSWAYKIGDIRTSQLPPKLKNDGRRRVSLFRLGFDLIRILFYRT